MAVWVVGSVMTSFTFASCSAFATNCAGSALHGTTSIFSPRSSFTTMRTREPLGPTQAPTGSTAGSREATAIFERCPGSRATSLISTMPSSISGTSISNSLRSRPGCVRDTTTCGPFVPRRTRDVGFDSLAVAQLLGWDLLRMGQEGLDLAKVEQHAAAVPLLRLDD